MHALVAHNDSKAAELWRWYHEQRLEALQEQGEGEQQGVTPGEQEAAARTADTGEAGI